MLRFSRCYVTLLLVLLLLPAGLQAAEPRRNSEPSRSTASAGLAWNLLAQVWSLLTGAPSDNGCEFDPNGRCHFTPPAADNGCVADPDGRCRFGQSAPATADNGCEADPNGRCRG